MNTYADGSSQKSNALSLALALPGMLTTWMLNQPEILGDVPANASVAGSTPITAISDIGQTIVGQNIALDAKASFDPTGSNTLTYTWDFGDGTKASGITVTHSYTKAGTYTLKLTVSSPVAARNISKVINVVTRSTSYDNLYAHDQQDGFPPSNPSVIYPKPNNSLSDKVTTAAAAAALSPLPSTSSSASSLIVWIIGALILATLLIVGIFLGMQRRKSRG